jgi:hypothetical protein
VFVGWPIQPSLLVEPPERDSTSPADFFCEGQRLDQLCRIGNPTSEAEAGEEQTYAVQAGVAQHLLILLGER